MRHSLRALAVKLVPEVHGPGLNVGRVSESRLPGWFAAVCPYGPLPAIFASVLRTDSIAPAAPWTKLIAMTYGTYGLAGSKSAENVFLCVTSACSSVSDML